MFTFFKNKIIISLFLSLSIIVSAFLLTKVSFNFSRAKIFLAEASLGFEKIIISLNKDISVFAQGISPFFFPNYPRRLIYLADEILLLGEDLVSLNESLNSSLSECDCKNAQSRCSNVSPGLDCLLPGAGLNSVLGDPCKNRKEIKTEQAEISEKIRELTILQNLLKKEMETGLERELATLDPETAEELRTNLENLLTETEDIVSLAENNQNLPDDCSANKCLANCLLGTILKLDSCFGVKGEQKPIILKFKLKTELKDLDLGEVRVKNVHLGLPEKIEISQLGSLSPFTISGEEFVIPLDNVQKTLKLQIPKLPTLPQSPSATLSCPEFPEEEKPPEIWTVCKKAGWCEQNCPSSNEKCKGCNEVFVRGRGQSLFKLPNTDSCSGVINPNACNAFCIHVADFLHQRGSPKTFTKEEMTPYKALFEYFGFSIPDECRCDKDDPNQQSISYGVGGNDSFGCQECIEVPLEGGEEEEEVSFNDLDWFLKIFNSLSEMCQNLPDMSENGIPTPAAEDCFNPEKVVSKILAACEPQSYYACKRAGWCAKNCPGNDDKCEGCKNGFVRGRGQSLYTSPSVDSCTGPLIPSSCGLFCVHVADFLYSRDQPKTFSYSEMINYKLLFDFFGLPIPPECRCDKNEKSSQGYSYGVGGEDTLGCHECKPVSAFAYQGIPCNYLTDSGKVQACLELFTTINESPANCYSNPVETLKNKCEQLKKEEKELPLKAYATCALVSLYLGKLDIPTDFEPDSESKIYYGRKIHDYPSSILGCPASLPTIPKICLPRITLPDIKLPEFKIKILGKTLFHLKLPTIITEDLNFPCLELCNIDECRDIFPSLNLQMPFLSIPTVEIPPIQLGTVLGVPLPDIEVSPISFAHIPYFIPNLPSLADLTMPELEYAGLTLPKPSIKLSFSGIDLSAIWGYIITLIKNALGIPDFSRCISANLSSPIPLGAVFRNYYFSWSKYLPFSVSDIPQIPYCKDINQFCRNLKTDLAEVIDKVKEIESVFNEFVQKEIQSKLNKAGFEIQQELTKIVNQKLQPVIEDIRRQAEEQIREEKKRIVARVKPIEIPSLYLDKIARIPTKIPIPWPEKLKKIQLTCNETAYNQCRERINQKCEQKCAGQHSGDCNFAYFECHLKCQVENYFKECKKEAVGCLSYDLPTIPLSCLGYEKEFPIEGPGLQSTSFVLSINFSECKREISWGENPCPQNEFENNLERIRNMKEEIEKTSQEIINILE